MPIDDLQKTVLVPVLSLQARPASPSHHTAAHSRPAAGSKGCDQAATHATAADSICENVLRDRTVTAASSNPILAAAARLTTMAGLLRTATAPSNVVHFSQLLIDAVRDFDRDLVHTQVRHEAALVARYILCCLIDEAVLSTQWGLASGWAHRSLLRLFHNEANGGERFFSLLEHSIRQQHECRDLLELFYLCLSLGFEGQLHLDPRGHDRIETIRAQLFRILYAGLPRRRDLSANWRPPANVVSQRLRRPALHHVCIVIAIATFLCIAALRLWLQLSAGEVAMAYEYAFDSISSSEHR